MVIEKKFQPPFFLTLYRRPPSSNTPAPPPCAFSGYGVRVRAGADYWAGSVAEGAGEKGWVDNPFLKELTQLKPLYMQRLQLLRIAANHHLYLYHNNHRFHEQQNNLLHGSKLHQQSQNLPFQQL